MRGLASNHLYDSKAIQAQHHLKHVLEFITQPEHLKLSDAQ